MPPSMRPQREQRPQRELRPQREQHPQRELHPQREQGPRHASPRSTRPHQPGPDAAEGGGATWFTINVGRYKNADPKWLIPLLCRRGNITKREIGKIQILARETRVEIAPDIATSFAEAIRRPDPKDKNIHIEPLDLAP